METLDYNAKPRRRLGRGPRRLLTGAAVLLSIYVAVFLLAERQRKPAMNMAYFYYSKSNAVDEALFWGLMPARTVARWLGFSDWKHNNERPPLIYDLGP